MQKYLKISNGGRCFPEAFTVLGVSTARGEDSKIGQFGSGAKMGLNLLLRNNIPPIITSDNLRIEFATIEKQMGEKRFQQVIAEINGEVQELGFATEFGELDWTDVTDAVREFVSNAYDQGDMKLEVVDTITEDAGRTCVYVPYTQEIQKYHLNIKKYFLAIAEEDFIIGDNETPQELLVYRKGVLVHANSETRSLFRYNIDDIRVNESRHADSAAVSFAIAYNLYRMSDRQAERYVKAMVEGEQVYETTALNPMYIYAHRMGTKLKDAFERVYAGHKLTTPRMLEFCSKKERKLKIINACHAAFLSEMGLPFADTEVGKTGAENGCTPISVSTDCKRIFNRIWKKLEKAGLTAGKQKPILRQFVKPMENGGCLNGYYDPETQAVYIERDSVSANVILEEIAHYITGAGDCTRDFQDFAFKVSGAFI